MRQKPGTQKSHGEKVVKDIRRATRMRYSAEEKIRIVLDGKSVGLRILGLGLDASSATGKLMLNVMGFVA